jgi:hypothetical protein
MADEHGQRTLLLYTVVLLFIFILLLTFVLCVDDIFHNGVCATHARSHSQTFVTRPTLRMAPCAMAARTYCS